MRIKKNEDFIDLTGRRQWRSALKRIKPAIMFFRILFGLFLIFVVSFYLFFPEGAFKFFGIRPYLISYTGSMEPELSYYDMIFVRKCNINELKEGDIITFWAHRINSEEQIIITHSVEQIFTQKATGKLFIRTKGIARINSDTVPVTIDGSGGTNTLIGKYVFKSVALGRVSGFLKSKYAVFAALTCICGSCLMSIIIKRQLSN